MAGEKKSFGKMLGDLFLEKESETESSSNNDIPEEYTKRSEPIVSSNSSTYTPPVTTPTSSVVLERDLKFEQQIRDSIRSADQPGPDYLEFSDAIRNLVDNLKVEEEAAIKSSFAVLKPNKLDNKQFLEIIVKTGEHYLDVLENESSEFEKAVLQHSQKKVQEPKSEIDRLNKENSDLNKQILELTEKVRVNTSIIEVKAKEIATEENNLENKKRRFQYTLDLIKTEIRSNINKAQKIFK